MQYPTCTGVRIRDIVGAHVLFYAVLLGQLPIVVQRLNPGEREAIQPETAFVWEERDAQTEATGVRLLPILRADQVLTWPHHGPPGWHIALDGR